MLGAVVAFCIIIGAFAIIKNKISKKDMFCEIEILINQKKIKTKMRAASVIWKDF